MRFDQLPKDIEEMHDVLDELGDHTGGEGRLVVNMLSLTLFCWLLYWLVFFSSITISNFLALSLHFTVFTII